MEASRPPAPAPTGCADPSRRVTALLAAGVPLTLLCDLLEPAGPHSCEIFEAERDDAALAWIPGVGGRGAAATAEGSDWSDRSDRSDGSVPSP